MRRQIRKNPQATKSSTASSYQLRFLYHIVEKASSEQKFEVGLRRCASVFAHLIRLHEPRRGIPRIPFAPCIRKALSIAHFPYRPILAQIRIALSPHSVAAEAGLKIGIDLPAISVDNDEQRCLSLTPHLSSIKLNLLLAGENAVASLERRLEENCSEYTPRCPYLTRSARPEWTRCSICSRTGPFLLDAVPFQCGYAASPAYLKTYFKKQTGMTMHEWRRSSLK